MKSFFLVAQILILNIGFVCSQSIDSTFHDPVPLRPAKIKVIKVLPEGKMIVGGDIAVYNGKKVNNLIRLSADGSLDEGFNFFGDNNLIIKQVELQSTGDLVVLAQPYNSLKDFYGYTFSMFLLDSAGNIKKETNSLPYVSAIAIQDDDKVLVSGLRNPNGFLNRYNADLNPDDSFDNSLLFNDEVTDVVYKNGNIFAVGLFSQINDTVVHTLVKLDSSGAIVTDFDAGLGTTSPIGSLTVLDDGRIIPGNTFISSFDGIPCNGMVILHPDGSVDNLISTPLMNGYCSRFVENGDLIYYSSYNRVNGIDGSYLFRLTPTGEMDPDFNPILIDELGNMDFQMDFLHENIMYNNSSSTGNPYGLSLSDLYGKLIGSFRPEICRYGIVKAGDYFHGKLVVSGDFIRIDSTETFGIAMINEDGTVEDSFRLSKNLGKPIQVKVLNDTCLLFSTGKSLVKLDSRGQILPDFNYVPFKISLEVLKFRVLNNNKIYGSDTYNIFRLNPDGTRDLGFDTGTGIGGPGGFGYDMDVQDDKVLFGSIFDHFNEIPLNKLVRLNSDGSVDQTFNFGTGPNGPVTTIKVLTSGEIIIGGIFTNFNGVAVPHGLVKLGRDGQLDNSFNNNQKNSSLNGIQWFNTKVEQADTLLYITGMNALGLEEVVEMNVYGNIRSDFALPVTVNQLNDIIVAVDSTQPLKTTKSTASSDYSSSMFTLGNFQVEDEGSPVFLLKLAMANVSLPTPVIDNNSAESVRLYPMPVSDKLYFFFSGPQNGATISLYSLNGVELYSAQVHASNGEVDMDKFGTGIYLIKFTTAEGQSSIHKIVKK